MTNNTNQSASERLKKLIIDDDSKNYSELTMTMRRRLFREIALDLAAESKDFEESAQYAL